MHPMAVNFCEMRFEREEVAVNPSEIHVPGFVFVGTKVRPRGEAVLGKNQDFVERIAKSVLS